jgi:surface protein
MPKYIFSILVISNLFSQVDYSIEIQPIFNNYCTSCHIDGGAYFGGLDLSSYTLVMEGGSSGNTIVPYEHADSELYQRITLYQSDDQFMPQNGSSLPQSDIDLIAQWIDEGALEVPNTSFQPESNQELQAAVDLWISNIDSALSVYGQINSWDVSLIWDMSYLFKDATNFNDDISIWDVSNVNLMYYMFYNTTSFNQDLSSWNVSNVERMHGMFQGASTFDGDISIWDVSNVTSIYYMFSDAANFNQDISNWDISNTSSLMQMFSGATSFNQDISNWNTENVTSMSQMFQTATSFDQDISNWDISNVQNMNSMFDMFNQISNLSDENKCLIHTAFSSNSAWEYDWSELCELSIYKAQIPNDFIIHQNYPNPFNPITILRYDLPKDEFVTITVYDMLGRQVKTLINGLQSSGYKSIQWNATNNQSQPVSAGVYLYKIQAGDFVDTKKMILLK